MMERYIRFPTNSGDYWVARSSRATTALALSKLCLVILATIILAFHLPPLHAQGFAGLGTDAGGFAEVVRGKPIAFPADHGAHPDFRIEWWYLTANLRDAEGNDYGVQWTLFRQAMVPADRGEGWANRQIWMGHAALTGAATHRFAERFARGGVGQAGATAAPFVAFIDNWEMRSTAPAASFAPLNLTASAPDFSYALTLATDEAPVLHGEQGFSRKSERDQASYYYSLPDLAVTGSIVRDGKTIAVTGRAWFDHEWSSQPLASDETGWD
jgi:predicted secreted hydrolase